MQSKSYSIAQAFFTHLQALAGTQGVQWLANPPLPLPLQAAGAKGLFCLVNGDVLVDQTGQDIERRRTRVIVGAFALTETALVDADALHFAARNALKSRAFRAALVTVQDVGAVREVEIKPELNDVAGPGSVLMSGFEIDYTQTYPSLA